MFSKISSSLQLSSAIHINGKCYFIIIKNITGKNILLWQLALHQRQLSSFIQKLMFRAVFKKSYWKFLESSNENSSCRALLLIKLHAGNSGKLCKNKISPPYMCSLFNTFKTAKRHTRFFILKKTKQVP